MPDRDLRSARVFIVDDEPMNVRILERLLGQEGYADLVAFTDSREVMPAYEAAPPDIVLLDLLMPHVDGFEILRRISERAAGVPAPPVVVLTADVTREARERALSHGASDFVTKPFDHLEVLLRVRNHLARRALEMDLARHNDELEERVRARTRELRRNVDALRRITRQREFLVQRFVGAQEAERARVAAGIQDDTLQAMVAVGIRLELLDRRLTARLPITDADPLRGEIDALRATVSEALERLRRLSFDLRPASLDWAGLAPALRESVAHLAEGGGPAGAVEDRLSREPSPETRLLLFRIAQEALANVRVHARAQTVRVTLADADGGIRLTVTDDGRGFDPLLVPVAAGGPVGLAAMSERAALVGGWCRVDSAEGRGTTVTAWVPVGGDDAVEARK